MLEAPRRLARSASRAAASRLAPSSIVTSSAQPCSRVCPSNSVPSACWTASVMVANDGETAASTCGGEEVAVALEERGGAHH